MVKHEFRHFEEHALIISRRISEEMDRVAQGAWALLRGLAVHPSVINLNSEGCDNLAKKIHSSHPEYLNILGARMDGQNFCSAVHDPLFRRLNYNDREWFQEGKKGRPHAGNVHISKYFKRPAVMLTMPVFHNNKQVAVLGAALDLESLSSKLRESIGSNFEAEIIILDRTGEVMINTKNPGKTIGIDLTKKEGTLITKGVDGVERIYTFTTSSNGWRIITGIPVARIEAHINKMKRDYFGAMFILSGIGLLIALMFSLRLKKDLKLLLNGINLIEQGDYSTRIHLQGKDEMARLAGAFNNLSERLDAVHSALREREEFYRTLIENSSDIILIAQKDGRLVYASPSVKNLGYKPENINGRSLFEFLDPFYIPEVKGKIDHAINTPDEIVSTTIRAFSADGSLRILSAKGRYLKSRDYLIINCMDITEETKKEVLLNDVLSSISEGFLILDRDMRIVSANKAYLERMKTDLSRIKGRFCWEVSHRTKEPCYFLGEVCPVKETLRTGEPAIAEHVHYTDKGETIHVEIRSYPIKDISGNVTNVIEVINDLTEKKRLEAQLIQAQKMEAVGQLAGGVAHDFNNILTAVSGYGSLLDMKLPKDSPLREYVAEIMKAVERGSNLARGLLAFSRRQPGNPRPVDINDIVRMVMKLLSKLIREDIELRTELSDENLIVMADAGHIEQILMNLATNARDAMPEGGVLTIKTGSVVIDEKFRDIHGYGKPGEYCLISISDTGIGMDENIKSHIFEPFFTTKEEGTGLGLSIVYGLVKQYNGYINVYSEPGKGSTFKIYLPIYRAKDKSELFQKQQTLFIKGLGETVLVVDDDPTVRESLKNILEFASYRVIEASDGTEALSIYKNKRNEINLVITDLIMPKMNGKVLYDEIKAINPSQKIVFMSGHTAESLYKQYLPEKGVLLFKPILPSEFLRKIREVLEEQVIVK
ncbi:MAG: PAS domain S-box protein [Thermodesulfovibrionales bacterium]|nr:PAS domain S-box protein [Thermodesulfovibrionales bacterium]